MLPKVYIDGHVGTTGLRIRDWMASRNDVELLTLPEAARKDSAARRDAMQAAAVTVLCLPDDAAREAVGWAEHAPTKIIDASTAHRVAEGWVYGLPELAPGQRAAIRSAKYVSNPGCHASAIILLMRPLIDAGIVAPDAPATIHALTGYSGGGRQLIEKWEDRAGGLVALPFEAPYALDRVHKHMPEVVKFGRLAMAPHFVPAVGPFRCGMRVEIPLHERMLTTNHGGALVWQALDQHYRREPFVQVAPFADPVVADDRSFDPQSCNDTNRIRLHVLPHPSGHVLLIAILDNLGKGASGVAIQNLNLLLNLPETSGLRT